MLEPQKLDPPAAIAALPPSVRQLIFKPPEIDGLYRYIVAGSVSKCPEVVVDLSRACPGATLRRPGCRAGQPAGARSHGDVAVLVSVHACGWKAYMDFAPQVVPGCVHSSASSRLLLLCCWLSLLHRFTMHCSTSLPPCHFTASLYSISLLTLSHRSIPGSGGLCAWC